MHVIISTEHVVHGNLLLIELHELYKDLNHYNFYFPLVAIIQYL